MISIESLATMSQKRKAALTNRAKENLDAVIDGVVKIVNDVKKNGDAALKKYTEKFDGVALDDIAVSEKELDESIENIQKNTLAALKTAIANIHKFHKSQLVKIASVDMGGGMELGRLSIPLDSVGAYVPGGKAIYPSSVIMSAVPAKIAGVKNITICTPPDKNGKINDVVLAAAKLSGVTKIFKVGGAQAIAAMAYGTKSVPKAQKIVGPGNVYVTAAKRVVYGDVDIDFPAGPSEVLIIADDSANPKFIAADMLAQIEHDPQASSVLVTTSRVVADAAVNELDAQLSKRKRRNIIEKALRNSAIIVAESLDEAIAFSNDFAPEHLEIMTKKSGETFRKITNAGSIFIGDYAPVPVGDYCSGTNHILPTAGYAKIYSGVSVDTFLKKPTYQIIKKDGLKKLKKTATALAEIEGLEAHANAIRIRFGENE